MEISERLQEFLDQGPNLEGVNEKIVFNSPPPGYGNEKSGGVGIFLKNGYCISFQASKFHHCVLGKNVELAVIYYPDGDEERRIFINPKFYLDGGEDDKHCYDDMVTCNVTSEVLCRVIGKVSSWESGKFVKETEQSQSYMRGKE